MKDLTFSESKVEFSKIIAGKMSEAELAEFLIALRTKGESPEEIAGAAMALREGATPFDAPKYLFADTAGTGGDGLGTLNVSTAVAFVAAQAGLPVAKHGNVAASSQCGSADVLRELGVKLEISPATSRLALDEVGVCFLFAPYYHAGLRFAAPVRKALKTRTIFNLLGPLANPAHPPVQIVGVYDPKYCETMAHTLKLMGTKSALVVHGSGLDEVALHGPTQAALLQNDSVKMIQLHPNDIGVSLCDLEDIKGGTVDTNARAMVELLRGDSSTAYAQAVALNTGALLWIAGVTQSWKEGFKSSLAAIRAGKSYERLLSLARMTNGD